MSTGRTVCPSPSTVRQTENRGLAWVVGAFLICPCHLPVTLAVIAALLSGTAAGTLITAHAYVAGAIITAAWIAATWRGIAHLRAARTPAASLKPTERRAES